MGIVSSLGSYFSGPKSWYCSSSQSVSVFFIYFFVVVVITPGDKIKCHRHSNSQGSYVREPKPAMGHDKPLTNTVHRCGVTLHKVARSLIIKV